MMTADQAVTGLTTIVGAGGVSAIVVAFFGYLTAARAGRPTSEAPTISIGGGPDGPAAEASSLALGSIAAHLARLVAVFELDAEGRYDGRDFRSQVDGRELLILRADVARDAEKD